MTTQIPKFDVLWRESIEADALIAKSYRRLAHNVADVRRGAYRKARTVVLMRENYHNELLDMIRSEGKTIDQWMDEGFELIEHMNETRENIMAAFKSGVTEREYVERGEIVLATRKPVRIKTEQLANTPIPPEPTKPMTLEERLDYQVSVSESLRSRCKGLSGTVRELKQANARLERRIEMLERALKRAHKTIEPALTADAR